MRAIQYGDATAVVAGGSEAALTPLSRAAFGALDALSRLGQLAAVRHSPGRLRDGRGSGRAGAGGRRGGPRARRAHPRECCAATARRADAYHMTAPRPSTATARPQRSRGRSRTPASRRRTSSTSTPTAPRRRSTTAPRRGAEDALGERAGTIPISSTKSAIGHLLGAGGRRRGRRDDPCAARAGRAPDARARAARPGA